MRLADVAIRRPVFAVMLISALLVFGVLAYPRMGVDLFPNVEFPVVTVLVVYPGADPETMETKVADPIEEKLNTLGGIKVLRSVNLESVTQVVVQFELEVNADMTLKPGLLAEVELVGVKAASAVEVNPAARKKDASP